MGKQIKKLNNHIVISLILFLISSCLFSQDKLNFGTTSLPGKQLQVDKYDCTISPSFSINEESPENLKLNFTVSWMDKKGSQVQQPDKISLFIKVNNNIDEYCSSNDKELSTKLGLFGKKSIDLVNSISFVPNGVIELIQYRNIHFKENMPPLLLNVSNFSSSPVTLDLIVYIGKEKGNSLEIDEKADNLSWKFILPEIKAKSEVSCAELESKYQQQFEDNKPQFNLRYFEDKLTDLESAEDAPITKLHELRANLFQYKSNVNMLISLKQMINLDPNFKKCNKLNQLIGSINSVTVDVSTIQGLINRVNVDIKNNTGGAGTGGDELPLEAFETNNTFCESTFNQLYNVKIDPDLLNNYEPNYLNDLYVKLKNLKISQDSIYNLIISADESPIYKRAYKNFNANHGESMAIIETLNPDVSTMEQAEYTESSPLVSKGRSFPYTWIIIPLLLIIGAFGAFKYFKYIKKGKSLKDKTK